MPQFPEKVWSFLGLKLSKELKPMLSYAHMLKFAAKLKPKFVVPPSLVIGMHFNCKSD